MPSTVIRKFYYDSENKILKIVYVSGAVYDYYEVPPKVFDAFSSAFSKGTFLNREIKPFYRYEKKST